MDIATCILNWKRPEQAKLVIERIKKQTTDPEVWLWNNNPEHTNTDFGADERIDSSVNLKCWPRWTVMAMTNADVVFTWDDDLVPTSDDVIERAYNRLLDLPDDGIVGTHGVRSVHKGYWEAEHIHNPGQDTEVDVVKGRFMMLRRQHLCQVAMEPSFTTDDIRVSASSENKLLIGGLGNDTENLEEGDVALWKKDWQKQRRSDAAEKYF